MPATIGTGSKQPAVDKWRRRRRGSIRHPRTGWGERGRARSDRARAGGTATSRATRGRQGRGRAGAPARGPALGRRAAALDDYFWRQANARLTHELITVVVNRCGCDTAAARRLEGFVRYCRTVTTAVLLRLDEEPRVTGGAAALTWRLSQVEAQQAAAEAWLDAGHQDEGALGLESRAGYALPLPRLCPRGPARRFTARGAVFAAG